MKDKELRNTGFLFWMTSAQHRELKAMAKRKKVSMSKIVRNALARSLSVHRTARKRKKVS